MDDSRPKQEYITAEEKVKQAESILSQIWTLETTDPERKAANLKIFGALGLFAGGIAFLRYAGDLITPVF